LRILKNILNNWNAILLYALGEVNAIEKDKFKGEAGLDTYIFYLEFS